MCNKGLSAQEFQQTYCINSQRSIYRILGPLLSTLHIPVNLIRLMFTTILSQVLIVPSFYSSNQDTSITQLILHGRI